MMQFARTARLARRPQGQVGSALLRRHAAAAAGSSSSTTTTTTKTHTACGLARVPFHREGFAAEGLYNPANERANCGVGIVCQMDGSASRAIVEDALLVLARMSHRGGTGCDVRSGDGAGILLGMPDAFMRQVAEKEFGRTLPPRGRYAVGNMFFGHDALQNDATKGIFHKLASLHGFEVLGWRAVPTDNSALGAIARASEPLVEQVFMAPAPGGPLDNAEAASGGGSAAASTLARELYRVRKVITNEVRAADHEFYVASLDANTIVYKGLLTARQIPSYFVDLQQPALTSHLGMVHSRFSTNTVPSWDRAQPNRRSCHNGEINTLRGNMNAMRARCGVMRSPYYGDSTAQVCLLATDWCFLLLLLRTHAPSRTTATPPPRSCCPSSPTACPTPATSTRWSSCSSAPRTARCPRP